MRLYELIAFIGLIVFFIGAMGVESADLFIPFLLIIIGALLLAFGAWKSGYLK